MKEFTKERNALIKEYGAKLEQLGKKYSGKIEAKKSMSAGLTNTTALLSRETWMTAWSETMKESAKFGRNLIDIVENELDSQYSDFKAFTKTEEEIRIQCGQFHQEMLELFQEEHERLVQFQHRYRESYDQLFKIENSNPSEKLEKKVTQLRKETINHKIDYLLQIVHFNKIQSGLFEQQYPFFYSAIEDITSSRIGRIKILQANSLRTDQNILTMQQEEYHDKILHLLETIQVESDTSNITDRCKSILQQHLQKNKSDVQFEHSGANLDDASFVMTKNSESFLINLFHKKTEDLDAIRKQSDAKRKECDGLERLKEAYQGNPSLGDYYTIQQSWLQAMKGYTSLVVQQEAIQAQISEIKSFMQEQAGKCRSCIISYTAYHVSCIDEKLSKERQHRFKPTSFTISSTCRVCRQSIWGLSKSAGFSCEGIIIVHTTSSTYKF